MDEWWAMYVSMDVCRYVCMHMCVSLSAAWPGAPGGENETVRWRHGGMDGWNLWGEGGRHLRFNLAVSLWKEGGGRLSAFEPNAALGFQGCRLFGGFQRLVGYQTGGVRGHVCVPCK